MTIEEIIADLDLMKKQQEGAWVVKHEGKILTMQSGKGVWKKKNHASSAFVNHMKSRYYWRDIQALRQSLGITNGDSIGQYLIKQGIVTIEQL